MPYKDPEKKRAYHKAYSEAWYQKNRELVLERNRAGYTANREHRQAQIREYAKANPEVLRRANWRHQGMCPTEAAAALASGKCCGMCGAQSANRNGYSLHVDHDHCTGRVRGLLCTSCNMRLGTMEKTSSYTDAAIAYLGIAYA